MYLRMNGGMLVTGEWLWIRNCFWHSSGRSKRFWSKLNWKEETGKEDLLKSEIIQRIRFRSIYRNIFFIFNSFHIRIGTEKINLVMFRWNNNNPITKNGNSLYYFSANETCKMLIKTKIWHKLFDQTQTQNSGQHNYYYHNIFAWNVCVVLNAGAVMIWFFLRFLFSFSFLIQKSIFPFASSFISNS